jgi:hypothetical protein
VGMAREDLVLAELVTMTVSGGTSYSWTLIDVPTDVGVSVESSAGLSSDSGATVTINPDLPGTYNGTVTSGSETIGWSFYAGPPLGNTAADEYFPRRIPGFLEGLAHNVADLIDVEGNRKGWSREWRRWFEAINWLFRQLPRRVDAVALGPVDLAGTIPSAANFWDGVEADPGYVLLNQQTNVSQNGIYRLESGVLTEYLVLLDMKIGHQIISQYGDNYAGKTWQWTGEELQCLNGPQLASPVVVLEPLATGGWSDLLRVPLLNVSNTREQTVVVDGVLNEDRGDTGINYPPWRIRGALTFRKSTWAGGLNTYVDDDALTHYSPSHLQVVIVGNYAVVQGHYEATGGYTYTARVRAWTETNRVLETA